MSEQSAIRSLQAAIENVRATCTGPECKPLLAAVGAADAAAEKYLGEPNDSAEDTQSEKAPTLKQAPGKARELFAQSRKEAAGAK